MIIYVVHYMKDFGQYDKEQKYRIFKNYEDAKEFSEIVSGNIKKEKLY